MKSLIVDIEADSLDPKSVWCVHTYDIVTHEIVTADNKIKGKAPYNPEIDKADVLIGHNIIDFDLPVLRKFGYKARPKSLVDTLVMSKVAYQDMFLYDVRNKIVPSKLIGLHSLKAWGYRLGILKGEYGEEEEAWHRWTKAMSLYCVQDLRVTNTLYTHLYDVAFSKGSHTVPLKAFNMEHYFATLMRQQREQGVHFDYAKAEDLMIELAQARDKVENLICSKIQGKKTIMKKPSCYIASDGTKYETIKQAKELGGWKRKDLVAGDPAVKYTKFNPNSRKQVAEYLINTYKWKPVLFTEKNKDPKIDDEILQAMPYNEAKHIATYMTLSKRLSQLSDGDKCLMRFYKDGKIHGRVNSNGAISGRCTHNSPNLAQIPRVTSLYGEEFRSLFYVPEPNVLVGFDADGLEARMLAHYLYPYDKGRYADIILHGEKSKGTDWHSLNAKILGCPRDTAKTWWYAFQYGAQIPKLASILFCSEKHSKSLMMKFYKAMPELKRLQQDLKKTVKKQGYLIGLDGRRYPIRATHAILNTLCQGAGAIVMKLALVLIDRELRRRNWRSIVHYLLNIHDEAQLSAPEELGDKVGKLCANRVTVAGKQLGIKIPITASYKVGHTWAETH